MIGPEGFHFSVLPSFGSHCLDPPYMKFHFSDGFLLFFHLWNRRFWGLRSRCSLALFLHFRCSWPLALRLHSRCSLVPFLHSRSYRPLALHLHSRCSLVPFLHSRNSLSLPLRLHSRCSLAPFLHFRSSRSPALRLHSQSSLSLFLPLRSFLFLALRLHLRSSRSLFLRFPHPLCCHPPDFFPSALHLSPPHLPDFHCRPHLVLRLRMYRLPLPVFHLQPPDLPHCRKYFPGPRKCRRQLLRPQESPVSFFPSHLTIN